MPLRRCVTLFTAAKLAAATLTAASLTGATLSVPAPSVPAPSGPPLGAGLAASQLIAQGTMASADTGVGLKGQIRGLIDRDRFPAQEDRGAVTARVVDVNWAALQLTPGGALVHPNDIDRAIDASWHNGFQLKLRVRAGIEAPAWAKALGGSPIQLHDVYTGKPQTIGRFWTPAFSAAYADLQARLASTYDRIPQIRETTISQCQTQYAETYLRGGMDVRNPAALAAAGLNTGVDAQCHADQIRAHQVWTTTLSDLALNPYQAVQPGGGVVLDDGVTAFGMQDCRAVLGARCVLENNSIREGYITRPANSHYGKLYAGMRAMGAPLSFQTSTVERIRDWRFTLAWAAEQGAASVELPHGYQAWPSGDLLRLSQLVAAN